MNLSRQIELEKAANDGGFEIIEPQPDGTVTLASSDVEARLIVIADDAGFLVAVDDDGLARELATKGAMNKLDRNHSLRDVPIIWRRLFGGSGGFPVLCRMRR